MYKTIISELTKFNWCNVCSTQSNVNVTELRLNEFDNNILLYIKLVKDSKFNLDRQK